MSNAHPLSSWLVPAHRYCLLAFGVCTGALAWGQGPTVTLTASNYNGYNIICFGARNGAIDAAVSGGTPPYTFAWTNGALTEDISGVAAGYYKLVVTDANSLTGEADITLVEPPFMKIAATAFKYPNGLNISCHECFNGSINVEVDGGVPPYAYDWGDDVTTQDRTGLGSMSYEVIVTDGNGCVDKSVPVFLKQPDSDDWKMGGNANTVPATQFIGTTDAQDFVLKSNGEEMMVLKSNGDISLLGSLTMTEGPLYRLEDGNLRSGIPVLPPIPPDRCRHLNPSFPYWQTEGNAFPQLCPEDDPVLGTLESRPLKIITNGVPRILVTENGKVGIGTVPPEATVTGYRLFVEGGIATRDVLVKLGDWPDYVFNEDHRLMPLGELRAFLQNNKHMPNMPSASALEEQGGAELGDIQRRLLRTVEEQALYILQLEERLEGMERRLQTLETSR